VSADGSWPPHQHSNGCLSVGQGDRGHSIGLECLQFAQKYIDGERLSRAGDPESYGAVPGVVVDQGPLSRWRADRYTDATLVSLTHCPKYLEVSHEGARRIAQIRSLGRSHR
jgi:hypothetical protein